MQMCSLRPKSMNESGASSMQCTYIDEIITYRIYGGGVSFEVDQRTVEVERIAILVPF